MQLTKKFSPFTIKHATKAASSSTLVGRGKWGCVLHDMSQRQKKNSITHLIDILRYMKWRSVTFLHIAANNEIKRVTALTAFRLQRWSFMCCPRTQVGGSENPRKPCSSTRTKYWEESETRRRHRFTWLAPWRRNRDYNNVENNQTLILKYTQSLTKEGCLISHNKSLIQIHLQFMKREVIIQTTSNTDLQKYSPSKKTFSASFFGSGYQWILVTKFRDICNR